MTRLRVAPRRVGLAQGRIRNRREKYAQLHKRKGIASPDAPGILFGGRPVYPNPIFVDGCHHEFFPQMDVWLRCRVGPI